MIWAKDGIKRRSKYGNGTRAGQTSAGKFVVEFGQCR